jgi:hypothetical protein
VRAGRRPGLGQGGAQLQVLLGADLAAGEAKVGVIERLVAATSCGRMATVASTVRAAAPTLPMTTVRAGMVTAPAVAVTASMTSPASVLYATAAPWTAGAPVAPWTAAASVATRPSNDELDAHHHREEQQDHADEVQVQQTDRNTVEHTSPFLEP